MKKALGQACLTINAPFNWTQPSRWDITNWAPGYYTLGELARASEYFTKAFELREHASEREKLTISADYYASVTGQLDKVKQAYQELIVSSPRDFAAYANLGITYASLGLYERAAETTRQAQHLAPEAISLYSKPRQ